MITLPRRIHGLCGSLGGENLRIGIMLYRRLADVVVIIHCIVCVFFLFGAFLAWKYSWIALIHIPLAAWVSAAFILGWTCPLTPLENRLRKAAGSRGYEGSFVDHYLGWFLGMTPPADGELPCEIGRRNEIILGTFFCILTIVPYGAKLGQYHDAIWPPLKPTGPGAASGTVRAFHLAVQGATTLKCDRQSEE
ncbi:MAG TPA: DUF2784 domain-containing protein [Pirellulales bacterium]|jgi:hypothetical protein|nr:DUF2784 domain-containing protein [Pirellulales bacterium]